MKKNRFKNKKRVVVKIWIILTDASKDRKSGFYQIRASGAGIM